MKNLKQEFMNENTNNKKVFIDSWNNHIAELVKIGYPLIKAEDGLFDELTKIQDRLEELVIIAADEDFK